MNERLLAVTEANEATRLQQKLAELTDELTQLEEEWLDRSAELEST